MVPSLLQRYVLREIVAVVAVAAVALTAIFFVGLSVSYTRDGLSIIQIYYVIPYLLMLSMPYALPSSVLLASVLVFGRLGARHELDAMRASGVNLHHVVVPPLVLALALGGGTFFLNHYLFPWTMVKVNSLRTRLILDIAQRYGSGLKHGFEVKPYFIYIGGADARDNSWKNVALIQFAGEIPSRIWVADKAVWRQTDPNTAAFRLTDVRMLEPRLSEGQQAPIVSFIKDMVIPIPLNERGGPDLGRPKYLAFGPLLQEISDRGKRAAEILAQLPPAIHPKTAGWKSRNDLERASATAQAAAKAADEKREKLNAARSVVEKEESDLKAAQAAQEIVRQRSQDAKALLAGKPEDLENLQAALKRAKAEAASRGQIADLEAEVRQTAERVSQLRTRIAEADKELERASAAAQAVAARLQADKQTLAQAQAVCNVAVAAAQAAEKTRDQIRETVGRLKTVERWIEAKSEFHFRNAGAVTCLVFALVGIPLGIVSRRGTILIALAISFAAVLFVHYPLLMIGDTLADDGYLAPWIANWMANGVMGCLGLALLLWGVKR